MVISNNFLTVAAVYYINRKLRLENNENHEQKMGLSKKETCLRGRVAEWPIGQNYMEII